MKEQNFLQHSVGAAKVIIWDKRVENKGLEYSHRGKANFCYSSMCEEGKEIYILHLHVNQ